MPARTQSSPARARPSATSKLRLKLKKPLERRIRAGHPWIFKEALHVPAGAQSGIADVLERSGRFVCRGVYDDASPIGVRVWTTAPDQPIDRALIQSRIERAAQYRAQLIDTHSTDAYRLCHGEADLLPAIVCDIYGHTGVVRIDSEAVAPLLDAVSDAVRSAAPQLRRLLVRRTGRRRAGSRDKRAQAAHDDESGSNTEALFGTVPDGPVRMREHGMLMEVDVSGGHKTGAYLDQRENRKLVRTLAKDRRVLDVFAYTGGFALAAALGGARSVKSVETSAPALAAARRNFLSNGVDPESGAYVFEGADAFQSLAEDRARYDMVILDPPSMAPSASSVDAALAAYRRLNALALARLEPAGLLLTASCSSHVTEPLFLEAIARAAVDARRVVRIVEIRGPGADHPSLPAFPEGRYLKVVLCVVD